MHCAKEESEHCKIRLKEIGIVITGANQLEKIDNLRMFIKNFRPDKIPINRLFPDIIDLIINEKFGLEFLQSAVNEISIILNQDNEKHKCERVQRLNNINELDKEQFDQKKYKEDYITEQFRFLKRRLENQELDEDKCTDDAVHTKYDGELRRLIPRVI